MHYHGKVFNRTHRFLSCDCDVLDTRKTKNSKDIGELANVLKYFTILYRLPDHEQQLGLEGPIQ